MAAAASHTPRANRGSTSAEAATAPRVAGAARSGGFTHANGPTGSRTRCRKRSAPRAEPSEPPALLSHAAAHMTARGFLTRTVNASRRAIPATSSHTRAGGCRRVRPLRLSEALQARVGVGRTDGARDVERGAQEEDREVRGCAAAAGSPRGWRGRRESMRGALRHPPSPWGARAADPRPVFGAASA